MILFRSASAFFLLTVSFANAQTVKSFPTDDEISLVVTQTERAVQQLKPLIDQEEIRIGKSATDAVAKDRQVVEALELAVNTLKSQPQVFNSPLGFSFFEWLDDASRNSALCGSNALSEAAKQITQGNIKKVDSLIHLAQSCTEVSTLLDTVSENAGALYQRYVAGIAQLADQATDAAQKCVDVLKKNGAASPKK
jgi:hypothetical protein